MNLNTTHEDTQRPAHDAAKSKLSKTRDNLVKEQSALAEGRADLDAFNTKLDESEKLPKDAAHVIGEFEGAVSFYSRRVTAAKAAVTEAQTKFDQADYLLTEAKVLDRAETLSAFDYDDWAAEFATETQAITDRYLDRVYQLNQIEAEVVNLGRSIGLDSSVINPDNRARIQSDTGRYDVVIDGRKLLPVYASLGLGNLKDAIRDTRADAAEAEAQAEQRAQREAEQAEQKAEREQLEAYKRFQTARTKTFEYDGATAGRRMVTRSESGEVLTPMSNIPSGHTVRASRG